MPNNKVPYTNKQSSTSEEAVEDNMLLLENTHHAPEFLDSQETCQQTLASAIFLHTKTTHPPYCVLHSHANYLSITFWRDLEQTGLGSKC